MNKLIMQFRVLNGRHIFIWRDKSNRFTSLFQSAHLLGSLGSIVDNFVSLRKRLNYSWHGNGLKYMPYRLYWRHDQRWSINHYRPNLFYDIQFRLLYYLYLFVDRHLQSAILINWMVPLLYVRKLLNMVKRIHYLSLPQISPFFLNRVSLTKIDTIAGNLLLQITGSHQRRWDDHLCSYISRILIINSNLWLSISKVVGRQSFISLFAIYSLVSVRTIVSTELISEYVSPFVHMTHTLHYQLISKEII